MDNVIDLKAMQVMNQIWGLTEAEESEEIPSFEYNGITFSTRASKKKRLEELTEWKAREQDVFVAGFPKSGTTWTQEIAYVAKHGGKVDRAQKGNIFMRIPWLEGSYDPPPQVDWSSHPLKNRIYLWFACMWHCVVKLLFRILVFSIQQGRIITDFSNENIIEVMPSPRVFKTHLPVSMLPTDIFVKKAKVIYVLRNPKDLAVSYFHYSKWDYNMQTYDSWDEFYDAFMCGKVGFGKWHDHVLGYWKRRNDDNILILKYEEMKKDERAAVVQICEFLGYHYSDDIIDGIVKHTTFANMRSNPMTNPDMIRREKPKTSFMRKGVVGDWKNYFSDDQNKAIEALCEEKFAGTGLSFEFE